MQGVTAEPDTGDSVGRWRLGDMLGEGGMGRVYRARRRQRQPRRR